MSKKSIAITLHKSELIYDIQNKTYLTGKSREAGNNHEQVANMQASEDEEHMNQLLRSIGSAYNELKTKLADYLSGTSASANDILLTGEGNLELTLQVPSNFNQAVTDMIASGCHKYIVNISVAEWFSITKPDEASTYITLATNSLEEIREAINKRVRPMRTAVTDENK